MNNYNAISDDIIQQIKDAVSGKVYVGDEVNEDFFHDEMPIYGDGYPDCLVDATSKEDVAAVMKICNENKGQKSYFTVSGTVNCPGCYNRYR